MHFRRISQSYYRSFNDIISKRFALLVREFYIDVSLIIHCLLSIILQVSAICMMGETVLLFQNVFGMSLLKPHGLRDIEV